VIDCDNRCRATLREYIRHAKRFGTEAVYETAAGDLTRAELAALAEHLRRLDGKWRMPQEREVEKVAYPAKWADQMACSSRRFVTNRGGEGEDLDHPFRNAAGTCKGCGKAVSAYGVGRRRKFCSPACRQAAYRKRVA
jgi:hypothetical protein